MTIRNHRLAVIAVAAGIALAAGTGTIAASAATPPNSPTVAAAGCSFGEHLLSAARKVPTELRDDLKQLRAMKPGPDRRADAKKLRSEALDGRFGPAVEARAQWRAAHPGDKLRPLPAALKADLKVLHGTPKAGKAAEVATIAQKAVSGGYGATIESFAQAVKASTAWKGCSPAGS